MLPQTARSPRSRWWPGGLVGLILGFAVLPSLAVGPAGALPIAPAVSSRADCDAPEPTRLLRAATVVPAAWQHAQAVWLDGAQLRWPQAQAEPGMRFRLLAATQQTLHLSVDQPVSAVDDAVLLEIVGVPASAMAHADFPHVQGGVLLRLPAAAQARLGTLLQGPLLLVQEDADGRVRAATSTQIAGALDALYAGAETVPLGIRLSAPEAATGLGTTDFALWAPTARAVSVCLYADARGPAVALHALQRDAHTGVWQLRLPADLRGQVYTYLVDVHHAPAGWVRHRVGDPYALSLTADSRRSAILDLDAPQTQPPGWDTVLRPPPLAAATDAVIYELHVRDFSAADASVRPAWRGRYLAFTEPASDGMRHLQALAAAGVTEVHLLPVFDLATIPETGCISPRIPQAPPDSEAQQAAVAAARAQDCFNWGYDPLYFNAPEGSYATDADDPAVRVREFRAMVQALHRAGLRVGMDVVYNHTSASGLHPQSVLDRIVPGYYQRLNAEGRVETSTCCDNTATEHRMMARLMIDSAVHWVRHYRIDGFRFDLMGHQPREAMLRLQQAVDAAAGRHVPLIGEGWNFGEVANGARFRQASQLELAGTGIATFSDRGRDAVRGGGCCDGPQDIVRVQGWINGLHLDRNADAQAAGLGTPAELAQAADLVRLALAGTLRDLPLPTHDGRVLRGAELRYAGGPAGYVAEPGEVVNYVENHDNPTLFDLNVLKLPRQTSAEERARVQVLGLAVTALSQGMAYFHAGVEILRSKSGDRNSYDSGDWFNRIDWTLQDNGYGSGLPLQQENAATWDLWRPRLADPAVRPSPAHIRWTRDAFLDLLRIRASSTLLRLRRAQDIQQRLHFLDTGVEPAGAVIVARLDGQGEAGAGFQELVYAINVDIRPHTLKLDALAGLRFELHPVHRAAAVSGRGDQRAASTAAPDRQGRLTVPPRTAVVFVRP